MASTILLLSSSMGSLSMVWEMVSRVDGTVGISRYSDATPENLPGLSGKKSRSTYNWPVTRL